MVSNKKSSQKKVKRSQQKQSAQKLKKSDRPSRRSGKSKDKKNVSLKEIAGKITSAITKPFKKDTSKKKQPSRFKRKLEDKKPQDQQLDEEKEKSLINEVDEDFQSDKSSNADYEAAQASAQHPASSFFYSDEKFISTFEDSEIRLFITQKFPDFKLKAGEEPHFKRVMIQILDDEAFMKTVLERYNMNIQDFIKFLFRCDQSLFKGPFIQRIQRVLKDKPYADIKFPDYKFRTVQRAMARRKKLKAAMRKAK